MLGVDLDQLTWKQGDDVVAAPLGDKLALLQTRSNTYYSLEGIGPFLWARLEQPTNFAELCAAVVAQYGVAADTAETDTAEWLGDMARAQLVKGEA